MSLLTLIQNTANEVGISSPLVVITSTDQNIRTLLSLSNTSGDELMRRSEWQQLTSEATFSTSGTISQGYLNSIATDYDRMISDTMWDRSLRQKIMGPVNMQEWQQDLSFLVVGPPYKFIVYGGKLFTGPTAIAVSHTVAFNYISKSWCTTSGGTGQSAWAADTDLTVLPERIHKLDLIWRFKQAKGLAYGEDLETAETAIEKAIGQSTPRRTLFVGGSNARYFSENVPLGSWPSV